METFDALFDSKYFKSQEALNKFKTFLLNELFNKPEVYLYAISSDPKQICSSILKRIETKLYVKIPDQHVREGIFKTKCENDIESIIDLKDYQILAQCTETFNSFDI